MTPRRLATGDGVHIVLYRARAYRDGRPAVLLVHGAFASHRLWLGRDASGGLAHFFTERGLDVWLADLRDHGASDREPRRGQWRFEDWILRDAPALVGRVREESQGAPLLWLGHSAGGAAGLCWLARCAAPGALAAVVTLGTPGPHGVAGLRRVLARSSVALGAALGRFPARLLRLGSDDEASGVLGDWLSWNVRRAWIGHDGFDYLAAWSRLDTPFLSVAGGRDRLFAPPHACAELVQASRSRRAELLVAPGLSHVGLARDARARERCWPRVAHWIEDMLRETR